VAGTPKAELWKGLRAFAVPRFHTTGGAWEGHGPGDLVITDRVEGRLEIKKKRTVLALVSRRPSFVAGNCFCIGVHTTSGTMRASWSPAGRSLAFGHKTETPVVRVERYRQSAEGVGVTRLSWTNGAHEPD